MSGRAGTSTWLRAGSGRLIVLSGPSGVGKDTVLVELFRRDPRLRYSVSYTTRPPRPGELDGVSYSFVDRPTFEAMAAAGEFLEWAEVHGYLYGTSLRRVVDHLARGEDVVLKIDVQGAGRVRRRVEGNAIFLFLEPPSLGELQRRLTLRRTEDAATRDLRMDNALAELAEAEHYDHRIVNDDLDRAVAEILAIIEVGRYPASASTDG